MAFSIRSAKVEQKARAYAARTGTTLTGALDRALDMAMAQGAMAQDAVDRAAAFETWYAPIREIQKRVAALPSTGLSDDEIMGWDENGVPT